MCLIEVPGIRPDDFLVLIEDHIDDEGKFQGLCRKYHIFVDRIPVKDSRSCIRTIDKFGAVVCHDRLRTGNSRKNALSPSGKSGKEMRFDKALRDQKIRLRSDPVDL